MPRLVHKKPGKRINIWLSGESLATAEQIDNLSNFFQLALKQASGIMAMDIIIRNQGLPNMQPPTAAEIAAFNETHPHNPLTQKRTQYQNEPDGSAPLARDSSPYSLAD